MVGMGRSTSEGSSALLLGFPRPHSIHTPDSWVTMGFPLDTEFPSMQWGNWPCSLGHGLGSGLYPNPGTVARKQVPPTFTPSISDLFCLVGAWAHRE